MRKIGNVETIMAKHSKNMIVADIMKIGISVKLLRLTIMILMK